MQSSDPLGFLLTWTTYGTWLHGDLRKSVTKKEAIYEWPKIENDPGLLRHMLLKLKQTPFVLELVARRIADRTIREVSTHRGWMLPALNIRTNHVHTVCCGPVPPEKMLGSCKAWVTRRLREAGSLAKTAESGPMVAVNAIFGIRSPLMQQYTTYYMSRAKTC